MPSPFNDSERRQMLRDAHRKAAELSDALLRFGDDLSLTEGESGAVNRAWQEISHVAKLLNERRRR